MRMFVLMGMLLLVQGHLRGQDSLPVDEETLEEYAGEEVDTSSHERVDPEALRTTRAYQEGALTVRHFDQMRWKEIVSGTDYNETPLPDEKQPIPLPWAGPLFKVISYIVVITVVVLLLYLVVKNISFDLRIEREKLLSDDLEKPVDDIETLDIEGLLRKARSEADFRMAIRLYYLGLLKKLHNFGIIFWKKDKTNRDYLMELFSRDFYYREIQRLTVSYEEVWYGEHILNRESFQRLTEEFEAIYRDMNAKNV